MQTSKIALSLACAAMVVSCGGGGNSTPAPSVSPSPTPVTSAATPAPSAAQCSVSQRQDFVLAQLQEWYLFPSLLDTSVNKADYSTVQDYIDALVAPARAQSRDRYFTYITSIAEENAFFAQGTTAGFGFRLSYDAANRRVFVLEAFEGAPALGMNIDRGSEILAIGTSGANLVPVATLLAGGDPSRVVDALGPDTPGTTRVLRVRDASGVEREVTLSKAEFALDPVSDRYGAKIISFNGITAGYLNLRTFIDTADDDLVAAFADFNRNGVTNLIIDLRYNGGGLVSIAYLLGDLMGQNRAGQVFNSLAYRESKSDQNETYSFQPLPKSIQPSKIAFIGAEGTASASELVINGMQPYLGSNMALIGRNTFGKPVGQIAIDRAVCDDRLRVVAFQSENANGEGDYYTGLASTVPNTCAAQDDLSAPLGDPREAMISKAFDFLAGRSCTPISATAARTLSLEQPSGRPDDGRRLLRPERPSTIDRDVPGFH